MKKYAISRGVIPGMLILITKAKAAAFGGLLIVFLVFPGIVSGQELSISQIDTSRLLTRQQVGLYVGLYDSTGAAIDNAASDQFTIHESADGKYFQQVPRTRFSAHTSREEGITFFLLVDNSGSMYETMSGHPTADESLMRITLAREAIRTFLRAVDGPEDTVGLAAFNTRYRLISSPLGDTGRIGDLLDDIARPPRAEGYTELYVSIMEALDSLAGIPGRKAVLLLSDGENFPYTRGERQDHPVYGDHLFTPEESIEALNRSGITLFAIRFGDEKEESLELIARESGGAVYDASDRDELAGIYLDIRERILQEYRMSYRALMSPGERKAVKVVYEGPGGRAEAVRTYFAGTLFGTSGDTGFWFPLIVLAVSLLLWIPVSRVRFINRRKEANLEVLSRRSTQVFSLNRDKTVIGQSGSDDLTIAGTGSVRSGHATVLFDRTRGTYQVVGDGPIKVNNKTVSKRDLEPGDVLNVGGTLIVFDEAPEGDEKQGTGKAGG